MRDMSSFHSSTSRSKKGNGNNNGHTATGGLAMMLLLSIQVLLLAVGSHSFTLLPLQAPLSLPLLSMPRTSSTIASSSSSLYSTSSSNVNGNNNGNNNNNNVNKSPYKKRGSNNNSNRYKRSNNSNFRNNRSNSNGNNNNNNNSNTPNNKRRTPQNSRVAIRWVVESIENVLKEERQQQLFQQNLASRNKENNDSNRHKNDGVTDGVNDRNDGDHDHDHVRTNTPEDDKLLVSILRQFYQGKTKKDIIEAGNKIQNQHMKGFVNLHLFSYSIQERVMKITAMAGLVQLSLHILDSMLCIRPRVYSVTSADDDDDDDVSAGVDSRGRKPHIPSSMSYIAVLTGLRRVKKLYVLEQTLSNLSNACQELHVQTEGAQDYYIDTIALNTYLGALCDVIIRPPRSLSLSLPSSTSSSSSSSSSTTNTNATRTNRSINPNELLIKAIELLKPNIANEKYSIRDGPDTVSFNTVLNAVTSSPLSLQSSLSTSTSTSSTSMMSYNNKTQVIEDIISIMKMEQYTNNIDSNSNVTATATATVANAVKEDIYTYNLRLKACGNGISSTDDKIAIIDDILSSTIVPDKYTIEQVLVPLAKEGRIGDILELLRDFNDSKIGSGSGTGTGSQKDTRMKSQTDMEISNAYSTFLIALVKGGEVDIARSIFDTYVLPPIPSSSSSISSIQNRNRNNNNNNNNQNSLFDVQIKPLTRHFNVLIEGYRSLNDKEVHIKSKRRSSSRSTSSSLSSSSSSSLTTNREKQQQLSPLEHATILFDTMIASNIRPDAYTLTSLFGLQKTSSTITKLWQKITPSSSSSSSALGIKIQMTAPVYHSIITAYGRVHDPSSACYVFDYMIRTKSLNKTLNSWNVLLSALSKICKKEASNPIHCLESIASISIDDYDDDDKLLLLPGGKSFIDMVDGKDTIEIVFEILDVMKKASKESGTRTNSDLVLRPNAQSYCLVASAISHRGKADGKIAIELYQDALEWNIPADGRFINAIIRCFGNDVDGAIDAWKTHFRNAVASFENRDRPQYSKHKQGKNLIAAYHGLVHVAGRADRPDIALRIAYAMRKEGYEPTESTLNSYMTGSANSYRESKGINKIAKSIRFPNQYENLLTIECTKYNKLDKRRSGDKKVRIII